MKRWLGLKVEMVTVEKLIEHLNRDYKSTDVLAVAIWSIDDVKFQATENMDIELTDAVAEEILNDIDSHQDANLGITWDTIETYIREADI